MKHIIATILLIAAAPAFAWDCGTGGTTRWDETTNTCQPLAQSAQAGPVRSSSRAGAAAGAISGSGSQSDQNLMIDGGDTRSRSTAIGLVFAKIDGLVRMPDTGCPFAESTQETQGQWGFGARITPGTASTSARHCVIAANYNSALSACKFLRAKRIQDAWLAETLPKYEPESDAGYIDMTHAECRAYLAPPPQEVAGIGIAAPIDPVAPAVRRRAIPSPKRASADTPKAGQPCGKKGERWVWETKRVLSCDAKGQS